MSRLLTRALGAALLAALAACSQAYSDGRSAPPQVMVVDEMPAQAALGPYSVEVIGESGGTLPTFDQQGRFYIQGEAGERYIIRVTNPTDNRIEAVVTVDGLDVIDGESGDLRKRGYVVPPHGELRIEGFRTSTAEVATFRFSSVGASYASRKGKARNVGVIAVAIFEEAAQQQIIVDEVDPSDGDDGYYRRDSGGGSEGAGGGADATKSNGEGRAARRPSGGGSGGGAAEDAPSGGYVGSNVAPDSDYEPPPPPQKKDCCGEKSKRPGLGTEYGERRHSAASWTRFVRGSDAPAATAELRYNDASGLAALGILVQPEVDPEEINKRETADPFPGDPEFSRPPAGIR